MNYKVIATMPTTGEILTITTAENLPRAEEVKRSYELALSNGWIVTIEPDNVVTLDKPTTNTLADTIAANKAKQEKLREERAKDNKSVMQTYKIKS